MRRASLLAARVVLWAGLGVGGVCFTVPVMRKAPHPGIYLLRSRCFVLSLMSSVTPWTSK